MYTHKKEHISLALTKDTHLNAEYRKLDLSQQCFARKAKLTKLPRVPQDIRTKASSYFLQNAVGGEVLLVLQKC